VLAGAACAAPAEEDAPDVRVSDDGGRVRLEEVATIGCPTCPELEQISTYNVSLDADGLIWVADRYEPHMRVFRTDGELVGAFGPTGQGPGDFATGPMESLITGHALLAPGGGRIIAYQMYPVALIELDTDGDVIDNRAVPSDNPFGAAVMSLVLDRDRRRVFMMSRPTGSDPGRESFVIERFDLDEDPLVRVPVAVASELFPGRDPEDMRQWFGMDVAPDGTLAVGDSLTYETVRLDADGSVITRLDHPVERPLRDEDSLESARIAARRQGMSEDDVDIHDLHFFRNAFEFDDAGRLWVLVNRPSRDSSVIDVFAPDGTYAQQLEVPYFIVRFNRGSTAALQLAGGYLVATVVGSDEEDRIKVWRVVPE
jgi:hypothetical protein